MRNTFEYTIKWLKTIIACLGIWIIQQQKSRFIILFFGHPVGDN